MDQAVASIPVNGFDPTLQVIELLVTLWSRQPRQQLPSSQVGGFPPSIQVLYQEAEWCCPFSLGAKRSLLH